MQGTPIDKLTIDSLQGDFYELFKNYVEKHGAIWTDEREADQLQCVYIHFPPETMSTKMPPSGHFDRQQITFKDGATMFWYYQRLTERNLISIPYVFL